MVSFKILTFSLMSMLISMGCSATPNAATHDSFNTHVKGEHSHVPQSKQSLSQKYTKPGAAISYSYNVPADIKLGETINVQLTLRESYNSGVMEVSVGSTDSLRVLPASTQATFDMTAETTEHIMNIPMTVDSFGKHYLNIQAVANIGNGQVIPRVFSIPVNSNSEQFGKFEKPQSFNKKTITLPSGKEMILLDAEETIMRPSK